MKIENYNPVELESRQQELLLRFNDIKAEKLSLDLTRGKPCPEQLSLSDEMDGILEGFYLLQDGTDVRNYGGILGIPEARQLGAKIMGIDSSHVMAGGNSSLTLMYNYIEHMLPRWRESSADIKFLCPVPGYDRHFTICEHFGIEMICVPFAEDGPDMDEIFDLCRKDSTIKGIWCVPRYSNPTGHTYSTQTVNRFAKLGNIAGADFRIMWDDAYAVHHLHDKPDQLSNLMLACEKAGTENSVVMLSSTSKVTYAGAGIAFLGVSVTNLNAFEAFLIPQLIGFDKVNQLRHVRFLKDLEHIRAHMSKHSDIIRPRFKLVEQKLKDGLQGKDIASWTKPNGGYFVSLDTRAGIADKVIQLASDLGVKLTPAGATFPYGKDPENRNIRIAPTFPSMEELSLALDVLVLCIELAAIQHASDEN